jgi:hypothetical protein
MSTRACHLTACQTTLSMLQVKLKKLTPLTQFSFLGPNTMGPMRGCYEAHESSGSLLPVSMVVHLPTWSTLVPARSVQVDCRTSNASAISSSRTSPHKNTYGEINIISTRPSTSQLHVQSFPFLPLRTEWPNPSERTGFVSQTRWKTKAAGRCGEFSAR